MVDLGSVFVQMLVMLTVVVVGFGAAKLGFLDADVVTKLTRFLVNITLPCMVLSSVGGVEVAGAQGMVGWSFGLALLLLVVSCVATALFSRLCRVPGDERVLYLLMTICTNTGFLGIPVAQAIFGDGAVLPASIFLMVTNCSTFSVGFILLGAARSRKDGTCAALDGIGAAHSGTCTARSGTGAARSGTGAARSSARPGECSAHPESRAPCQEDESAHRGARGLAGLLKPMVNPATIACLCAIAVFLAHITLPSFLQQVLTTIGGVSGPMAMMLVGAIIAGSNLTEAVREWRVFVFIGVRQLLVPLLLLPLVSLLEPNAMSLSVLALMAAMPVGAVAPMVAEDFGYETPLVANATVLSTVLSFAIIPALLALTSL